MADWEVSEWWGGYIAFLGPYTGPMPSAPPLPVTLPLEAQELDYIIGFRDDLASSGFSEYVGVYREWDPAPGGPTFGGHFAGVSLAGDLTIAVIYYNLDYADPVTLAPPAVDPFTLVPPSFVAGGTGAPVLEPSTGHWSDWQPSATAPTFAFSTDNDRGQQGGGDFQLNLGDEDLMGDYDAEAAEESLRAAAAASSTDDALTGNYIVAELFAFAEKGHIGFINTERYIFCRWLQKAHEKPLQAELGLTDLRTLRPDLIEGIDYWYVPSWDGHPRPDVDYGDATEATVDHWGTWSPTIDRGSSNFRTISNMSDPGAVALNFTDAHFDFYWSQTPKVLNGPAWSDDPGNVLIGSVTVPAVAGDFADTYSPVFDLSAVPHVKEFFLYCLPREPAEGLVPHPNFPFPPNSPIALPGIHYETNWGAVVSNMGPMTVTKLLPQYRYWIPGPKNEPYLRFNQRDDGLGISGHARLHGPNGPTSRQLSRMQRIGEKNTYS